MQEKYLRAILSLMLPPGFINSHFATENIFHYYNLEIYTVILERKTKEKEFTLKKNTYSGQLIRK